VPKEAEKDLTALEPLPPYTHVFILGKFHIGQQPFCKLLCKQITFQIGISAYNAEMCETGRPPLLLNGIYISRLSQNNSRILPTVDEVIATYDKVCKVVPAQVEIVQKGIKTTVTEAEEFHPELKRAAQKTAKELPGKFAV